MKYTTTVIIPVYNQEELITRALESVPLVHQLIVVDDGSTDNTFKKVINFNENRPEHNLLLMRHTPNKGVGYTLNTALDHATGDYIVLLGSDDYFYPEIKNVTEELDGSDLVYFNMVNNDGFLYDMSLDNRELHVGSLKFMRRDFLEKHEMRYPGIRVAEDADFMHRLAKLNPTEKYTKILAKHYNYPREGSLSWHREKELKESEEQS